MVMLVTTLVNACKILLAIWIVIRKLILSAFQIAVAPTLAVPVPLIVAEFVPRDVSPMIIPRPDAFRASTNSVVMEAREALALLPPIVSQASHAQAALVLVLTLLPPALAQCTDARIQPHKITIRMQAFTIQTKATSVFILVQTLRMDPIIFLPISRALPALPRREIKLSTNLPKTH
jgi:hypothetical protein